MISTGPSNTKRRGILPVPAPLIFKRVRGTTPVLVFVLILVVCASRLVKAGCAATLAAV